MYSGETVPQSVRGGSSPCGPRASRPASHAKTTEMVDEKICMNKCAGWRRSCLPFLTERTSTWRNQDAVIILRRSDFNSPAPFSSDSREGKDYGLPRRRGCGRLPFLIMARQEREVVLVTQISMTVRRGRYGFLAGDLPLALTGHPIWSSAGEGPPSLHRISTPRVILARARRRPKKGADGGRKLIIHRTTPRPLHTSTRELCPEEGER